MVFFLPACLASGLSYDDCSVCVIEIIPKNKSHQLPAHHSQDGKVRPTTARQEQKAQQLPALTKVGLAPGGRRGVGNAAHLMASCKQEQAIISPQSPCPFNSAKYSLVVRAPPVQSECHSRHWAGSLTGRMTLKASMSLSILLSHL